MPKFIFDNEDFPPVESADEYGLVAIGGDFTTARILDAYHRGLFPWEDEPALWFCPDPRMVMPLDKYKTHRSVLRHIRRGGFSIKYDCEFREVMSLCADTREETWISEQFLDRYCELHEQGYAHSVEVYYEDNLVGGVYGISLGSAFFGESMFHLMTNASKIAVHALVELLRSWDFTLFDCQVNNPHLEFLGGIDISRTEYLSMLESAIKSPKRQESWQKHSPGELKTV